MNKFIVLSTIVSCLVYTSFGKTCPVDHYYDREDGGLCTACVTCLQNMVEIQPCGPDKPRKCQCAPGFKCTLPAVNSCARCTPDSTYKPPPKPATKPKSHEDNCCITTGNTKLCYTQLN
ncbi:hypothetical protein SKPV-WA-008 [Skunkpox virus]|uniref:TNFR-Cys domain-containing protein n=1 Tax=Skunkpox virus TaxID=160796 RepID=A0A1C9KBF1_9POXV|nr:hypothetical protein BIZ96_gp008 [Skunkpox virus]AOP31487.1 hypothetical protein SKPV-WA-008 [Skunkpox virus]